jgi:hypothetical protein
MATPNELPTPKGIAAAAQSADEVLRVWIIDRRELATVFPPGLYGDDVWKWGRLLANLARYVADAHARETGVSRDEALHAIALNFSEEINRDGDAIVSSTRERP